MPWFLVDDQLAMHSKVVAAGNAAMGLWVRAASWSMAPANLTDGLIPRKIARALGSATEIRRLIDAGLWHETEAGYQFHEWTDRQRPADDIRALSEKRARAGAAGGKRSGTSRRRTTREANSEASASAKRKPPVLDLDLDQNPSSLTVVCRLTSGDPHATTTTMSLDVDRWQRIAGPGVDLEHQADRFLTRNAQAGTRLDDPPAAWLGWLGRASEHASGDQPSTPIGCDRCDAGWLPEDGTGRRAPCLACKPHLRSVEAS